MCARCAELEERVAELELALGERDDATLLARLCAGLRVGRRVGRLVLALYGARGRLVPYYLLSETMEHRDDGDFAAVRDGVRNAREALGPATIRNVYGEGYGLTPAGVAAIEARLSTPLPGRRPRRRSDARFSVPEIREIRGSDLPGVVEAARRGAPTSLISRIRAGKAYAWVDDPARDAENDVATIKCSPTDNAAIAGSD